MTNEINIHDENEESFCAGSHGDSLLTSEVFL